jgi:hypothetical protein
MTKNEMIIKLKKEFPKLTGQTNNEVFDLSAEEYEATIERWADNRLKAEAEETESQAKTIAKSELLNRIGITAEEAALLLG